MAQAKRKKRRRRQRKRQRHAEAAPDAGQSAATEVGSDQRSPRRPRSRSRGGREEQPPAPWGSFPLVELIVLLAIVMVIAGFVFARGDRQVALVLVGLALGSLAGLEVAFREHFAGYRSHTMLLAAVPAAVALGLLFVFAQSLSVLARAAVGGAVFAAAAYALTRTFRSRSGGYAFKISTRTR